jgi:hypothetical protein
VNYELMRSINVRNTNISKMFADIKSVDEIDETSLTLKTVKGDIIYNWNKMNSKYDITPEGQKIIDTYIPNPGVLTYDEMVEYLTKAYNVDSKTVKDNTTIERNSNGDNNIYIVKSGDTVKEYEKVNDNGEYRIIEK